MKNSTDKINKARFIKSSFPAKKAEHTVACDVDEVTPGSPAVFPDCAPETPEPEVDFKTRGFPSPPHGGFGFNDLFEKMLCYF
jgi:hypothetical protein